MPTSHKSAQMTKLFEPHVSRRAVGIEKVILRIHSDCLRISAACLFKAPTLEGCIAEFFQAIRLETEASIGEITSNLFR